MKSIEKLFLISILLLGIPLGIYYLIVNDITSGYERAAAKSYYRDSFFLVCKGLNCEKEGTVRIKIEYWRDSLKGDYIKQMPSSRAGFLCDKITFGDTLMKKAKSNRTMVLKMNGDTIYLKERF